MKILLELSVKDKYGYTTENTSLRDKLGHNLLQAALDAAFEHEAVILSMAVKK